MKLFSRNVKQSAVSAEQLADMQGQLAAIDRVLSVITFSLDGTVLSANRNFLATLGYTLDEIQGKHHSMFVEPAYRSSAEYRSFWERLARGEFDSGQYKRIGKGGKEVWIQASYNAILGPDGKPFKVVKYATDVTAEKLRNADFEGQVKAINKAQAVVAFSLDGKVLDANENFLKTMGYTLSEIKGQHHSLFVDSAYRASPEYRQFWEKLGRGEYEAARYQRVGKGGRQVWIEATYNPILDMNGRPVKVIKFATDITRQVTDAATLQSTVQTVIAAARDGDLTMRIPLEDKSGSVEQLCSAVNTLVENLANIVGQVKEAAETIDTAAREINQGNTDLSQRTEQQASSLQQTAGSMEELTSTVKQNAESARQANQQAAGASDVAVKGGDVVKQVVKTMNGISESSKKIADIISVIDGIAFQTNILALNAAVEAARAGEQGRGFAVVATEVRNLAQRSANAAKEIKQLITESVSKVDDGSALVNEAGKTMDEIVNSVMRVTGIMGKISTASQEQSGGIEQVNQALAQMDEVTQQNAALVEEAAAAAESMQEQAGNLVRMVAQFKLVATQRGASPAGASMSASATVPVERRGPDRAQNVARMPARAPARSAARPATRAAASAATSASRETARSAPRKVVGGEQDWQEF